MENKTNFYDASEKTCYLKQSDTSKLDCVDHLLIWNSKPNKTYLVIETRKNIFMYKAGEKIFRH